tara:strand:+ start:6562 stop:6849 length:288 start_codon:yes stop_codon:yes gene_type:complete
MAYFQVWSVFALSLFSIWQVQKLYIYRYIFLVPIFKLSAVGWLVALLVAMLLIVNQLIIYEVFDFLFIGFGLGYSFNWSHIQYRPTTPKTTSTIN